MKATTVREYFVANAPWVDWRGKTNDLFLFGDGEAEVKGIAVGWLMTLDMAREAAAAGCNLFVSHEGVFYQSYWMEHKTPGAPERAARAKERELRRLGMTVLRCHDTWDRWPGIGIPDAWAAWLGLQGYRRKPLSFFGRAPVRPASTAALARNLLRRLAPLGQEHIEVFQPRATVRSLCIGTGAITDLARMIEEAKADCYLVTNDGSNAWTTEAQATDREIPLIRVDHATAELPGMMALAKHLAEVFPEVPVQHVAYPCPYKTYLRPL